MENVSDSKSNRPHKIEMRNLKCLLTFSATAAFAHAVSIAVAVASSDSAVSHLGFAFAVSDASNAAGFEVAASGDVVASSDKMWIAHKHQLHFYHSSFTCSYEIYVNENQMARPVGCHSSGVQPFFIQ